MDKSFEAPQGRLLPTLMVFVFGVGILYTLFLAFTQYSLKNSLDDLAVQKDTLTHQMEVLKEQNVAEVYNAQQVKTKVGEQSVRWSRVVSDLQQLTPVGVFLSSYGATDAGQIQLSGVGDDFGSVADMIVALTHSKSFTDSFVPSVTQGTTGDGQTVASFSLTTHVVKP